MSILKEELAKINQSVKDGKIDQFQAETLRTEVHEEYSPKFNQVKNALPPQLWNPLVKPNAPKPIQFKLAGNWAVDPHTGKAINLDGSNNHIAPCINTLFPELEKEARRARRAAKTKANQEKNGRILGGIFLVIGYNSVGEFVTFTYKSALRNELDALKETLDPKEYRIESKRLKETRDHNDKSGGQAYTHARTIVAIGGQAWVAYRLGEQTGQRNVVVCDHNGVQVQYQDLIELSWWNEQVLPFAKTAIKLDKEERQAFANKQYDMSSFIDTSGEPFRMRLMDEGTTKVVYDHVDVDDTKKLIEHAEILCTQSYGVNCVSWVEFMLEGVPTKVFRGACIAKHSQESSDNDELDNLRDEYNPEDWDNEDYVEKLVSAIGGMGCDNVHCEDEWSKALSEEADAKIQAENAVDDVERSNWLHTGEQAREVRLALNKLEMAKVIVKQPGAVLHIKKGNGDLRWKGKAKDSRHPYHSLDAINKVFHKNLN